MCPHGCCHAHSSELTQKTGPLQSTPLLTGHDADEYRALPASLGLLRRGWPRYHSPIKELKIWDVRRCSKLVAPIPPCFSLSLSLPLLPRSLSLSLSLSLPLSLCRSKARVLWPPPNSREMRMGRTIRALKMA